MKSTQVKLKNITENEINIHIYKLQPNEEVIINKVDYDSIINNECILTCIENNYIQFLFNDNIVQKNTILYCLENEFPFSVAIDFLNEDMGLSGNEWIEIKGKHIIWDLNNDFDIETGIFNVPVNGIYYVDGQFNIKNILNCSSIEIALFKREIDHDDFWFILDKKNINLENEIQLTFNTLFDFFENEKYILKIKLYGVLPSCEINGSDDYTAFGLSFSKSLYN